MNVKIRNKFIEIKYSVSNGLVIFITNYWWFRILEISRYRRSNGSVLKDTRLVNKFNSFIYERNFNEMPFVSSLFVIHAYQPDTVSPARRYCLLFTSKNAVKQCSLIKITKAPLCTRGS